MPLDLQATADLNRDAIVRRLRESYPEINARFGVRRMGLFGSFASDTANETSDVDLIVNFERPIGLGFVELVEYLETLGRFGDLGRFECRAGARRSRGYLRGLGFPLASGASGLGGDIHQQTESPVDRFGSRECLRYIRVQDGDVAVGHNA